MRVVRVNMLFEDRCIGIILAVAILLSIARAAGAAVPLLIESFDHNLIGSAPSGWKLASTVAGTSVSVDDSGTPTGDLFAELHDDNGSATTNNTLYRGFPTVTSGTVLATVDLLLPQNTAAFGVRLTAGGTPTSGGSWVTGVIFQGNVAYEGGPSPPNGAICYQRSFNP